MMPDPNSPAERQLWAAYRLILQWPKRDTQPIDPTDGESAQSDAEHTDSVQPDCEDVPVIGGN